ncbi:hypothetical protein SADUNF_Sadunf06G0168200 [Salix dunnii]|uniref:Uncharacterized protein n=1 Tax=Salix dunnii TaxID=1413687 RepID=A0A835N114_9ROSI|nr:hypothetical protein SADUNF_Sadunf06G0168200 [Salix dunnii]
MVLPANLLTELFSFPVNYPFSLAVLSSPLPQLPVLFFARITLKSAERLITLLSEASTNFPPTLPENFETLSFAGQETMARGSWYLLLGSLCLDLGIQNPNVSAAEQRLTANGDGYGLQTHDPKTGISLKRDPNDHSGSRTHDLLIRSQTR